MRNHFHPETASRKIYTCTEANCGFTGSYTTVKKHKETKHSTSTYFKFKCTRCSEGFRLANDLRQHKLFCCDPLERPHPCAYCGARFKYKHGLEFHYSSDIHKLSKEEARALVYPGLPVRPWQIIKRNKSKKKSKSKP